MPRHNQDYIHFLEKPAHEDEKKIERLIRAYFHALAEGAWERFGFLFSEEASIQSYMAPQKEFNRNEYINSLNAASLEIVPLLLRDVLIRVHDGDHATAGALFTFRAGRHPKRNIFYSNIVFGFLKERGEWKISNYRVLE